MKGPHGILSALKPQIVDAGAIRTSYVDCGQGKPVVLIHDGAPGADTISGWNGCIEELSKRYRVLALDMIGFGNSACPPPQEFEYSQAARTAHVLAFIEALGLESVSLIGNSMGAITALDAAIQRPDLVDRLVLLSPAGIKMAIPEAAMPLLGYRGTPEQMESLLVALGGPDYRPDPELVSYRTTASNQPARREAWSAAMQWIGAQGGLYLEDATIQEVKAEVMVISGKHDPMITPDIAIRFVKLINRCSCHVLARSGHWAVWEQPGEFLNLSSTFIG